MSEALKAFGALAWVVGLVIVFFQPLLGGVILLVAILITIRVVSETREQRHAEIMNALRNRK